MLSSSELAIYLLKHPSLKGPIKINPENKIIAIEWVDPVILPEEIKKLSEDTNTQIISFGYFKFEKLHLFFSFDL